jgi:hypothetical protein
MAQETRKELTHCYSIPQVTSCERGPWGSDPVMMIAEERVLKMVWFLGELGRASRVKGAWRNETGPRTVLDMLVDLLSTR